MSALCWWAPSRRGASRGAPCMRARIVSGPAAFGAATACIDILVLPLRAWLAALLPPTHNPRPTPSFPGWGRLETQSWAENVQEKYEVRHSAQDCVSAGVLPNCSAYNPPRASQSVTVLLVRPQLRRPRCEGTRRPRLPLHACAPGQHTDHSHPGDALGPRDDGERWEACVAPAGRELPRWGRPIPEQPQSALC